MKRTALVMIAGASLVLSGCATKNYVRKEVAPVVERVNELDELTAQNRRNIEDVDARATQGIQGVTAQAQAADQKAQSAGQRADQAQSLASDANSRATQLHQQVVNLDNYRPVAEATVHFGFDQSHLTAKAKEALDQIAAEIPNTKHYIVEVSGSTDSVGDPVYNYELSQRRAAAVVQYLAQEHNLPAHKVYVIGLGKDKPAASNGSVQGRRENRRVEVRLMTNVVESQNPQTASTVSQNN